MTSGRGILLLPVGVIVTAGWPALKAASAKAAAGNCPEAAFSVAVPETSPGPAAGAGGSWPARGGGGKAPPPPPLSNTPRR